MLSALEEIQMNQADKLKSKSWIQSGEETVILKGLQFSIVLL